MHVAQVDQGTNKVNNVIVVRRDYCMTGGTVTQAATQTYCEKMFGGGYNYYPISSTTKGSPAPGENYDASKDLYYEDQPYALWTLNETSGEWEAPVDFLDQNGTYSKQSWDEGGATWFAKKIGDMDGNWWKWNKSTNAWEDTGSTSK